MRKILWAIVLLGANMCKAQRDTIVKSDIVYDLVSIEEPAEFPGGDGEMMKFLAKNIFYPQAEKENDIQGKVFVTYIIDTAGYIKNVEIYKGVAGGPGLSKEAMRVVKMMPKWKPGKMGGKAVNMRFILPIHFKLSSEKEVSEARKANNNYNEGVKKFEKGEYEAALKNFNWTLETLPEDIDALYNKAICLLKLKQNDKACETLRKIQELGKNDANTLISKYCNN